MKLSSEEMKKLVNGDAAFYNSMPSCTTVDLVISCYAMPYHAISSHVVICHAILL